MHRLSDYIQYFENELKQQRFPETPERLYDPLRYFMELGGKRMRPVLTLMAAEAVGKSRQEVLHLAFAVEMFHNFSLIHDDIMDEAPLRRGKVTVHEKWGRDVAILSGDVLFVEAYEHLAKQQVNLQPCLQLFNKTAREVCEGQQMDMDFEQREDVQLDEYIEMIRLKTSVLLGCALELGALGVGADTESSRLLYEFGINLGIAFQIQDDILDLYGDPESFGKQIGGDVLVNKKTILHLFARDQAKNERQTELQAMYDQTNPAQKVQLAQQLYIELGAKDYAQNTMERYHLQAMTALDNLMVPANQKESLRELAEFLFVRSV